MGFLSLAFVTLDHHFPPFRDSFARFSYSGSAFSSFSGFFHSLWLPKSALSSFSGFFHSLWLPRISVFLLFGIHSLALVTQIGTFLFFGFLSLALVTLDQRFPPFWVSFALFGYPGSAFSSFSGFFHSLWLPYIGGK